MVAKQQPFLSRASLLRELISGNSGCICEPDLTGIHWSDGRDDVFSDKSRQVGVNPPYFYHRETCDGNP